MQDEPMTKVALRHCMSRYTIDSGDLLLDDDGDL